MITMRINTIMNTMIIHIRMKMNILNHRLMSITIINPSHRLKTLLMLLFISIMTTKLINIRKIIQHIITRMQLSITIMNINTMNMIINIHMKIITTTSMIMDMNINMKRIMDMIIITTMITNTMITMDMIMSTIIKLLRPMRRKRPVESTI